MDEDISNSRTEGFYQNPEQSRVWESLQGQVEVPIKF